MRISQIKMRISHIRVFAKFTNYKILNSAILIAIFNYQCCIYCCLLLAALTGISNGSGLVKVYVFVVIMNYKFIFHFNGAPMEQQWPIPNVLACQFKVCFCCSKIDLGVGVSCWVCCFAEARPHPGGARALRCVEELSCMARGLWCWVLMMLIMFCDDACLWFCC